MSSDRHFEPKAFLLEESIQLRGRKKVFLPRCLTTELRYVHSKAQVGKTWERRREGEEKRQRCTTTLFAVQHKKRGREF